MEPTETQVIPSTQRLAVLTALLASTGSFYHPTVFLYQNNVTLGPATLIGALTVATFAGYANVVAMPWEAPFLDVDGSALAFGTSQTIVATGPTPANVVYGYAAANSGLTGLWAAWAFAQPVSINGTSQAVPFLPALRYSGS